MTVLWFDGDPPLDSEWKTCDLVTQLNYHVSQFQSGARSLVDMITPVSQLRSELGVVQVRNTHL